MLLGGGGWLARCVWEARRVVTSPQPHARVLRRSRDYSPVETIFMIFFCLPLKDEKNQVLTTNIWLQMVSRRGGSPHPRVAPLCLAMRVLQVWGQRRSRDEGQDVVLDSTNASSEGASPSLRRVALHSARVRGRPCFKTVILGNF